MWQEANAKKECSCRFHRASWLQSLPTTSATTSAPSSRKSSSSCRRPTLLVIDDNSPDGTGQAGRRAGRRRPAHARSAPSRQARPGHRHPGGHALRHGARLRLLDQHGRRLQPSPAAICPPSLAGMERHDVMIGSRYVPGGGTENWPLSRQLISQASTVLCRCSCACRHAIAAAPTAATA